jgi:hypothetical protein
MKQLLTLVLLTIGISSKAQVFMELLGVQNRFSGVAQNRFSGKKTGLHRGQNDKKKPGPGPVKKGTYMSLL